MKKNQNLRGLLSSSLDFTELRAFKHFLQQRRRKEKERKLSRRAMMEGEKTPQKTGFLLRWKRPPSPTTPGPWL